MAQESKKMMQLVAVVQRGEGESKKSWWTKVGVAFENKDGSWNLRFDFVPTRFDETTLQLRPFDAKEDSSS